MSNILKTLKEELARIDTQVEEISGELSKAVKVRRLVLDRIFEHETGLKLGADVTWTPDRGPQKGKAIRVKLVCRDDDGKYGEWWVKVRPYKKDGTLGKNERQIYHTSKELKPTED